MAYRWFIRYKLYHIPFWLLYHYTWWIVTVGNPLTVTNNLLSPYAIKFLFYVFFQAAGVYFNLYFLLPRLLEKGKITSYVLAVLATIIVMAVCITTGYYASAWITGHDFQALYGVDPNRITYFLQVNTLPSSAASMTLAMSVKLAKKWFESRRRQEVLEKEKLATELNFLRHQFTCAGSRDTCLNAFSTKGIKINGAIIHVPDALSYKLDFTASSFSCLNFSSSIK